MKQTIQTRWLLWKNQKRNILFWMALPMVLTIVIISQFATVQEDMQIPIGIVLEEKSEQTEELVRKLKQTPHIQPFVLAEREAVQQLTKHELDSVFIIHRNYDENIQKGRRHQLVTTYQSDLSFAYAPVRETFISYIQQDYTRFKTVKTIQKLKQAYDINDDWHTKDLIKRGKDIEKEQQLLAVNFTFMNDKKNETYSTFSLNVWSVWALIALLATFMLFDWVIKESQSPAMLRLMFSQWSYKNFLWNHFLLYTVLLIIIDILAMFLFTVVFQEKMTIRLLSVLVIYRLTLNVAIFLISQLFRKTFTYYIVSLTIVLFAIIFSGIIIPIKGHLLQFIHPVIAFQEQKLFSIWLIICFIALTVWLSRKEEKYA